MMRKIFITLLFIFGLSLYSGAQSQYNAGNDDCLIFTPNAFTPNHDGRNDLFKLTVSESCVVQEFSLQIFDRWGRRVFYTTDLYESWDGTFEGHELEEGTYLWRYSAYIKKVNDPEYQKQERNGTAILIR